MMFGDNLQNLLLIKRGDRVAIQTSILLWTKLFGKIVQNLEIHERKNLSTTNETFSSIPRTLHQIATKAPNHNSHFLHNKQTALL